MSDLTREKAADLLNNLVGTFKDNQNNDYDAALRMGIEALTSLSAVARDIATIIENEQDMRVILSAQPQRMKGRWIDDCSCSNCHWIHENDKGFALLTNYHFCPNCGADMRKE